MKKYHARLAGTGEPLCQPAAEEGYIGGMFDATQLVLDALKSFGIPAVVAAAITGWLATRAGKRIDARTDARHATGLETLRKEHQLELQRLEALEARLEARYGVAAAVENAAHVASMPRRLAAVDQIWRAVVATSKRMPADFVFFAAVSEDEYPKARANSISIPIAISFEDGLTRLGGILGEHPEDARPFVSERLWEYYEAHRFFVGRTYLSAITPATHLVPWYKDKAAVSILEAALPADDGARNTRFFSSAQAALQRLVLAEIRRLVDGELAADRAVARVAGLQEAIAKASVGIVSVSAKQSTG